jgi:hypothetical protein
MKEVYLHRYTRPTSASDFFALPNVFVFHFTKKISDSNCFRCSSPISNTFHCPSSYKIPKLEEFLLQVMFVGCCVCSTHRTHLLLFAFFLSMQKCAISRQEKAELRTSVNWLIFAIYFFEKSILCFLKKVAWHLKKNNSTKLY